jgi:small subunit ribosomal protein S14
MSDKRNIQDHKRRLLAAKYELRRKLYKAPFSRSRPPSAGKTSFVVVPVAKKEFLCTKNKPMLCIDTGRPRGVDEFFRISNIFFRGLASRGYGSKEINRLGRAPNQ